MHKAKLLEYPIKICFIWSSMQFTVEFQNINSELGGNVGPIIKPEVWIMYHWTIINQYMFFVQETILEKKQKQVECDGWKEIKSNCAFEPSCISCVNLRRKHVYLEKLWKEQHSTGGKTVRSMSTLMLPKEVFKGKLNTHTFRKIYSTVQGLNK